MPFPSLTKTGVTSLESKLLREITSEPPATNLEAVLSECCSKLPIGTPIRVDGTGYEGKVVGYNSTSQGLYRGDRYPVIVEITKSSNPAFETSVGQQFCYGLEQIVPIEANKVEAP